MEMHAILWACDRGSAQENERAKSGFIVPVLLDFTNKGIILACADGVLICLVYRERFAVNEKDCLRYPDSPSMPRIYDFPIGADVSFKSSPRLS